MKNLKRTGCRVLTRLESQQINGGVDKPRNGFWQDVVFIGGAIVEGIIVFGTQGGRNAGISVR